MILIASFMAYWGSQHILLKTEDWPNLMNFEDPVFKKTASFCLFYPRYVMLMTEDLKTASLKSEDLKTCFYVLGAPVLILPA